LLSMKDSVMAKNRIKVLVLAGYYVPNLGYQENGWIKALVHYGLEVKVVASLDCAKEFKGLSNQKEYRPGIWKQGGFELQRVSPCLNFRSMIWARGMKKVIGDFAPDVLIVFGVGQLLPAAGVLYKKKFDYKLICIFGDNPMWRSRNPVTGKLTLKGRLVDIAFRLFKKPLYAKTIEVADTIGYNTDPATKDILRNCLSPSKQYLTNKMISLPLGFEGDVFYYSAEQRAEKRSQLGIKNDDRVFIYVSRVQPKRHLETLIDSLKTIMLSKDSVKLMIVGFLGDSYEAQLKEYISKQGIEKRVICLKLANRNELNAFYNAADIGVWHLLPTITLVEAMGTGLPIVIPNDPSFSSQTLPRESVEIFELGNNNSLKDALGNMLKRFSTLPDRETMVKLAGAREYKQIVSRAFKSVGIPLGESE
jgi:glycosyltransferase involved in cell wall biosynthesis